MRVTFLVIDGFTAKTRDAVIQLTPGQTVSMEPERAAPLLQRGKLKPFQHDGGAEAGECLRCPASAVWEVRGVHGWYCFDYALFPPVRFEKPALCRSKVNGCLHKGKPTSYRSVGA